MNHDEVFSALEQLSKLRESGVLTEAEFTSQKAKVLGQIAMPSVPFYRRLWFVVLLTCLLFTFPIALLILLTGDVYKRASGEAGRIPIKRNTRYVYAGALVLWIVALIAKEIFHPGPWDADDNTPKTVASIVSSSTTTADKTEAATVPAYTGGKYHSITPGISSDMVITKGGSGWDITVSGAQTDAPHPDCNVKATGTLNGDHIDGKIVSADDASPDDPFPHPVTITIKDNGNQVSADIILGILCGEGNSISGLYARNKGT